MCTSRCRRDSRRTPVLFIQPDIELALSYRLTCITCCMAGLFLSNSNSADLRFECVPDKRRSGGFPGPTHFVNDLEEAIVDRHLNGLHCNAGTNVESCPHYSPHLRRPGTSILGSVSLGTPGSQRVRASFGVLRRGAYWGEFFNRQREKKNVSDQCVASEVQPPPFPVPGVVMRCSLLRRAATAAQRWAQSSSAGLKSARYPAEPNAAWRWPRT